MSVSELLQAAAARDRRRSVIQQGEYAAYRIPDEGCRRIDRILEQLVAPSEWRYDIPYQISRYSYQKGTIVQ